MADQIKSFISGGFGGACVVLVGHVSLETHYCIEKNKEGGPNKIETNMC
jgi:hypothetical protein